MDTFRYIRCQSNRSMKHLFIVVISVLSLSGLISAQTPDNQDNLQQFDTSEYVQGDIHFNLLIAAFKGYDTEVLRLLNAGANINETTQEGVTALMYASGGGHLKVVRILLVNGADVHKQPVDGRTALISACQAGYRDVAEELIIAGARTNDTDRYGASSLHYASAYNHYLVCDMLLYYGANPNLPDHTQTTPLMAATYAGNIGVAEILIDQGAQIDSRDENGMTALMIAAQNGDTAFVGFLQELGGDIKRVSTSGFTAFQMALYNGHLETMDLLWESGIKHARAMLNEPNPYTLARYSRNSDTREWLQDHGFRKRFSPLLKSIFIGMNLDWNSTDYFLGFKAGVEELISGFTFELGYQFRPTAKRILIQEKDDTFYQFWEKRHMLSATLGNRITLYNRSPNNQFGLYLGLGGIYSFGPKYRGSEQHARSVFRMVPAGGFYLEFKHTSFRINYEYLNLKTYRVEPHWINLGVYFKFPLSTKKFSNKTIPWY